MAEKHITNSSIRVKLQNGLDPLTGTPVFARRNLQNLKPTAEPDSVYDSATALFSLQSREIEMIEQVDTSHLRK